MQSDLFFYGSRNKETRVTVDPRIVYGMEYNVDPAFFQQENWCPVLIQPIEITFEFLEIKQSDATIDWRKAGF